MNSTTYTEKKKMIVPKLRFKGFTDEWIDTRLKDLTNLITKGTTPQSFSSEGINYVKIEGLVGIKINKEKCLYIDEETHNKELRRSILQNNDLLFAIAGATIGKVAIVTEDILPANTNQALAIIRLKNIKNLKYVLQILQSRIMKKYIKESISVGAQPNLNLEQMGDFRFHLPNFPEQQKIASFLSAVDRKIQQLTRKKELLEQYKKGVMQQLFSGKLRFKPDSAKAMSGNDDKGKAFPKWEKKRLGDVGEIVSGLTYSPADVNSEGVLVLRSSNVQDRRLSFEDNVYVKVKEGGFNPVKENDILICVRNGSRNLIGKNTIIDKSNEGVAFGAFMTVYRSDSNLFLFHYFDTDDYKDEVHKNLGATINSINGSDLKKFKIPFPCKAEQKKIANYLSNIDNKIEIVNKQITQTQTFKKGLLQQMFV